MLKLYNTLTKQKENFTPLHTNQVGLYVCGMTVYDHCHLGHARVWVVFDMLVRYLKHLNYQVNYVRNITDIDDKIIQRAEANQEPIHVLTKRMIKSMHEDMQKLQLLAPTHEPKATDHLAHMIQLIQTLIDKGYAYVGTSGDVYYAVNQFQPYGELTHQALNELMAGARVAVDPHKKHALDFVLWKKTHDSDPVAWNSPWGAGRPGWHLECSAMALEYLGASFDLHGGGSDLKFPHHQNEIAQSEAATDKPFVRQWMHVGFVEINNAKMSKSEGNALSLKSLFKEHSPQVIHYFLLASHYRSPLIYHETHLQTAQKGLRRLKEAAHYADQPITTSAPFIVAQYEKAFYDALNDDLNTPIALSVLFDMARHINRLGASEEARHLAHLLKKLSNLLGLLQETPEETQKSEVTVNTAWIDEKIKARKTARDHKDWALADTIRQSLLEKGIQLEDTQEGTKWHYVN